MHDPAVELYRAVFLDRDGTINEEVGYLSKFDQLKLIPRAAAAIRMLNRRSIPVVVVTNQSGVARGYFGENFIREFHDFLQSNLRMEEAHIDAFYYCPHHPTEGHGSYRRICACRKPGTGMLLQAAQDLCIDLSRSYMVGDMMKDVLTARNTGVKGILVRTGYGAGETIDGDVIPDYQALDLFDAVEWILEDMKR
ncbi:MAG: HAD family hydrolase [Syntrophales bacterium]|jgi:D,D-heptose 1,7-bisphosphate phosphatase|nr:HAD family hydrolase [Syntrophales bacterium]